MISKIHNPNPLKIDISPLGIEKEQFLILSVAGSRMYGTNIPNSDEDYLGVYIPTKKQLFLNNYPRQLSLPKESGVDLQIWSIHHFLKLLCQGETMAIDLLHSPYDCWLLYNLHIWPWLTRNKDLFYTKNMSAFVSYARDQSLKYGMKGSNLNTLETVIKFLKIEHSDTKLYEIWKYLPKDENIHFFDNEPYKMYQVCGVKFQETVKISYILDSLQNKLTTYGKRAKKAGDNEGIDWKGISHAIRAAEQVYWIFKYGEYKYPLKNVHFITQVKMGNIPFEMAIAVLNDYMTEIEKMIIESDLPEETDREAWDIWLLTILKEYIK